MEFTKGLEFFKIINANVMCLLNQAATKRTGNRTTLAHLPKESVDIEYFNNVLEILEDECLFESEKTLLRFYMKKYADKNILQSVNKMIASIPVLEFSDKQTAIFDEFFNNILIVFDKFNK